MSIIQKAIFFAQNAHQGQKRKDGKEYFTHVAAVADIVTMDWFRLIPREAQDIWNQYKDHVIAAAYLHDTIEDCGVTRQQLINEGFSVMTAEIVESLSRKTDETYFDFIMRIRDSGAFAVGIAAVKLADLEHNMSDLKEGSLKDKYRFAQYILSNHLRKLSTPGPVYDEQHVAISEAEALVGSIGGRFNIYRDTRFEGQIQVGARTDTVEYALLGYKGNISSGKIKSFYTG